MTAIACLKKVRALIVAGDRNPWLAIGRVAANPAEALEAEDLLEAQAAPIYVAMCAAIEKWGRTNDNADARLAVDLARDCARSGFRTLERWRFEPGRTVGDVLELFSRTINKHRPGSGSR